MRKYSFKNRDNHQKPRRSHTQVSERIPAIGMTNHLPVLKCFQAHGIF